MSLTTGNNSIDSLVYSSWARNAHTPVHLTYSFMQSVPSDASSDDASGFAPMSATQQAAARDAMAHWASVANITFTEVASNGNIQLATNDQGNQSSGYAYLPDGSSPTYLFTNNQDSFNSNFTPGGYGPTVLLHELGHTLGLKHPGNYDSTGGDINGPFLPTATDNGDYTVMSYTAPSSYSDNGKYNITPMLYDIQAMQYLYGANMSYHTGDDTYTFTDSAPPQCIWDAGGTDTLDFSGCSSPTAINLNAGTFSSTVAGYNNISIAYNVTIEQVITGAGGSTVTLNSAGDTVFGGSGNDTITEGSGNDHINGGDGTDVVVFAGKASSYVLVHSATQLLVTGQGSDVLTGVEQLHFTDGTVLVDDLPVLAQATASQVAQIGSVFQLSLGSGVFTTSNGSSVQLSATLASGLALPSWLSFNSQTGVFSGVATAADAGELTIRVKAVEAGALAGTADDFKLLVSGAGAVIHGTDGNDVLTAGDGADSIDGGAGVDVVRYSGAEANYAVAAISTGVTVTDHVGAGGVDTLVNVERLEFSDAGLALDTTGSAGELYRLYEAMFNRSPDLAGVGYWLTQMDHGGAIKAIAAGFINSAEFKSLYGDNPSNTVYVSALYNNVLHRVPDQAGADYWNAALNSGATRAEVLTQFSDSTENVAAFNALHLIGVNYIPWHG